MHFVTPCTDRDKDIAIDSPDVPVIHFVAPYTDREKDIAINSPDVASCPSGSYSVGLSSLQTKATSSSSAGPR